MAVDITALYCCLDDFCKVFAEWETHQLIPSPSRRQRSGKLSRSEMLFIMVLFHLSPYKNFKTFYLYGIGCQYRACFRDLPHYDRFVSLMPRLFAPLMVLLHSLSGEETGLYFGDSSKLAVCHNRRIDRHRVFDGLGRVCKRLQPEQDHADVDHGEIVVATLLIASSDAPGLLAAVDQPLDFVA